MRAPKFETIIGAVLSLGALGPVAYIAVVTSNEIALGALISILSGAVGYYLRGRMAAPNP